MTRHNDKARGLCRPGARRIAAFPGKVILLTLTGLMALVLCGNTSAPAQEAAATDEPRSPRLGEDVTPMDKSFLGKPARPWSHPSLKDAPPFFRDTKLDLDLRTYYAYTDNFDGTKNEAWTLGGSLSYRSGWFLDHAGIGATLYTSQALYAPDDRDGTLLLKPGQEGYTVVGELYGTVKIRDEYFINIYRHEVNTPYMNKNDSRMTPNTFEGYGFTGAMRGKDGSPTFNYGAGYIDKIKLRDSDTFISPSVAAGASVSRGVLVGGVNASFTRLTIGAIDYYSEDIINIGYGEAKCTIALTDRTSLIVAVQFTDQRSVGENLLTGYGFNTNASGVKSELSSGGSIFTLAYTTNSRGADLQNPWSSYPGYTSVQVQSFNRAGEDAFMVKGSYDFSRVGLAGAAAFALWVHGWGAVDPLTRNAVYQQDEYDVDLQWVPQRGTVKGLWFRLRYAHVEQGGVSDAATNDFRVIVNYDLSIL